jgi:hypothetical protein
MRRFLAAFLLVMGLASPARLVLAQGTVRLSSVEVDLWPEYDRPAVLVMYRIELAPGTRLPAAFTLRVPAQALINAIAVQQPAGQLVLVNYQRSIEGPWAVLTISASALDLHVEYYDALLKNGTSRSITYQWPGDYPVAAFHVIFQQPSGASGLMLDPSPVQQTTGQDGLQYFTSPTVVLQAGQTYRFSASYQKPDDSLSASSLQIQPMGSLTPTASGQSSFDGMLPWVLGLLGLALVVGSAAGFVLRRPDRSTSQRSKEQPGKKSSASTAVYCPECGRRARPGDAFCRVCGSRLRGTR